PHPRSLLSVSSPPCSRTSARANGRPSPVPGSLEPFGARPNGSNAIATSSGDIPGPSSVTVIVTVATDPPANRHSTLPFGGVNLIAFDNRLIRTCFAARKSTYRSGQVSAPL